MSVLKAEVNRYKGSSLARSTQSTYRSHLNAYLRFCAFYGCVPIPADRDTICCYIAFLARSLSSSSMNGYLNIIRLLHLDAGLPNPLDNNWEVQQIKHGVARLKGIPIKQKHPITIQILREFFCFLDHYSSPLDKSFWAACLLAFYVFFRKSTILPISASSASGICRSDIQNFTSSSFSVLVKHTKTIQFGERTLMLPFHACADLRLCPVRAMWSHLTSSPVTPDHHVFTYLVGNRTALLTHEHFVKKLKLLIVATGRDPTVFSAHSFRRGGTTFAFSLNMAFLTVKARGDWKSNCVEQYISINDKLSMDAAILLSQGAAVN